MRVGILVDYLLANGLPVRDVVDPPEGSSEHPTVTINDKIAVVLNGIDSAQVISFGARGQSKILDPTTSYIGVVAGVKSFMPARDKLPPGPMA